MDREELDKCLHQHMMMNFDLKEAVIALLFQDEIALTALRSKINEQKVINKSYIDTFDASTDDHERNAVIGCVRFDEPLRPVEYSQKVADFRSGKIVM